MMTEILPHVIASVHIKTKYRFRLSNDHTLYKAGYHFLKSSIKDHLLCCFNVVPVITAVHARTIKQ